MWSWKVLFLKMSVCDYYLTNRYSFIYFMNAFRCVYMEVGEMERGNKEGGADHKKDNVFKRVCLRTNALKTERGRGRSILSQKKGGGEPSYSPLGSPSEYFSLVGTMACSRSVLLFFFPYTLFIFSRYFLFFCAPDASLSVSCFSTSTETETGRERRERIK